MGRNDGIRIHIFIKKCAPGKISALMALTCMYVNSVETISCYIQCNVLVIWWNNKQLEKVT